MDRSKSMNVAVSIYMMLVLGSLLFMYLSQDKFSPIFAVILTFPGSFILTELMYRLTLWLGQEIHLPLYINVILLTASAALNAFVACKVFKRISKNKI